MTWVRCWRIAARRKRGQDTPRTLPSLTGPSVNAADMLRGASGATRTFAGTNAAAWGVPTWAAPRASSTSSPATALTGTRTPACSSSHRRWGRCASSPARSGGTRGRTRRPLPSLRRRRRGSRHRIGYSRRRCTLAQSSFVWCELRIRLCLSLACSTGPW